MYTEILDSDQLGLQQTMKLFRKEFYLVGGTAIALQIGHRRSIDFDMFTPKPFGKKKVLNVFKNAGKQVLVTRQVSEQLNLVVDKVKITFFEYPYQVETDTSDTTFRIPNLLALAAMKAFALGRRSKWKDYVDLYFLFRDRYSLSDVISKAEGIYGNEFSAKLFRSQLAYHADIDYSEKVAYMPRHEVEPEAVKAYLIDKALEGVI